MQPLDEQNRLRLAKWRDKYRQATGVTPLYRAECWMCRAPFWVSEEQYAVSLKPVCSKQCEADLNEPRYDNHWN